MLAPVHHIIGFTTVIRERFLPISGEVLARAQQKVNASDIVAETRWARKHALLNVARELDISPEKADDLIQCKVGDKVTAALEIAIKRGVFAKSVYAPKDGRVVAIGNGQVLLEIEQTKLELRAGLPGTVIQVVPNRGVMIQAFGGLIQGLWGNGRIDSGLMVNVMEGAESVLAPERVDASMRGSIILGGMIKNAEALQMLADLPARGLIASSIHSSALAKAREMRYPILATDGIGSLPMNSAAYKLLSTNVRREVTVNAEPYDRYSGARPEVFIALPISNEPPIANDVAEFAPDTQVRLRRPPAMGQIGVIVSIKSGLTTLPSGLRAPSAEVKLENDETIIVPLVNMEVVG